MRECLRLSMCHMSGVTYHMSHVRCHVSHVRCHVSGVIFFVDKGLSLLVEGLLSTGPTEYSFEAFRL